MARPCASDEASAQEVAGSLIASLHRRAGLPNSKMADDDSLRVLADHIQARAVRRMGELLKEFDGRGRQPVHKG
jgi:hypothetical protein